MSKSLLFSPIQLAGVSVPNRVFVSPMCQYSSADGFSNDWHLVHLGSRAVGGAGLVFTEAAAVLAEGAGGKYLIQHSAGSGKTNSIAWSAHFLSDLHDAVCVPLRAGPVVPGD